MKTLTITLGLFAAAAFFGKACVDAFAAGQILLGCTLGAIVLFCAALGTGLVMREPVE